MPRPPRANSGEVANKAVTIRLTPSEHEQAISQKGTLSLSEFFRRAGLDESIPMPRSRPPIPEVNRETYLELGRIGNNLNQQTRACHRALHQGQTLPMSPEQIEAVAAQVEQVRLEVLGLAPADDSDAADADDW